MGKGTILGGGKDGLYLLNVDYGDQKRQQLVQAIDLRLTEVDAAILTATTNLANEQVKIDDAETALNASIAALEQAVTANPNADHTALLNDVKAKTDAYQKAAAKRKPFAFALETVKAEKANLISRRNYLADLNLIKTFPAWCADFTENATGQVATIEVPGEPRTVIIAPGAPAPTAANGTVQAREVMTPEQAFMNASLLPGWQKWKPTFRTGVITSISGNTCSVNLKYEESSAANLKINQTTNLANVPIQYMDCNGTAFSKNDEVIVRFDGQDWKYPKVVGFVKEPKRCVGVNFNGGVYRGWGTYDTGGDNKPNAVFRDTYFLLRTPLQFHKDFWSAANNEIVCTFSNANWGTLTLSVYDLYEAFGEKSLRSIDQYGNNYFTKYKTVYFNDGTPSQVSEEVRIRIETFWQDENAPSYPYYLLSPCNDPYLWISIEEYPIWGTLIAGHDFSYWEAAMGGANDWTISLQAKDKVLFSGKLTTYPQPLYPYYFGFGSVYPPGEPGKYPLDDAYVCLYTGDRRPATAWRWEGGGILIPPEVTWITT